MHRKDTVQAIALPSAVLSAQRRHQAYRVRFLANAPAGALQFLCNQSLKHLALVVEFKHFPQHDPAAARLCRNCYVAD